MPLLKGLLLCALCTFSLYKAACQAPPPLTHHVLRLEVEENTDPRGEPGMEPCASTDGELEELYKTCESTVGQRAKLYVSGLYLGVNCTLHLQ